MDTSTSDEPIVELEIGSSRVTLLGTAHVSRQSAETVATLIDSGEFDAVAIELCEGRYNNIKDPDSLAKMDLYKVIKEGKAPMVMASLALSAFQQRLADQFGIEPGAEMRMAMEKAEEHNLPLLKIDRDVGVTLKRVYRSVPWWQRMNIFSGLLASVVSKEKIEEKDIEKLKEGDMLESTFQEFAETSKEIYSPLIDERDQYMADEIYAATRVEQPKHLLAIVGAGHLKGIKRYLEAHVANNPPVTEVAQHIRELSQMPEGSKVWKWLPWVIVGIILFGFALGFSRSADLGWDLVSDWVLINGTLAAIGAIAALAHPLTIIGAFVAAPLTSLNPTIGAGMVTGAIEMYLRKPTVRDFQQLRRDTANWKGWWHNRVSKVLLVFFFCTLGSAIGTYVAGFKIFDKLF
jgi:pheromone shutdown-related protein TraB